MNNISKLLRGNVITGVVTVAIISSVDVVNIFRGRISGKQLFKNVANTAVSVGGGIGGWMGGATIGGTIGSFVPIIGTAVGGFIGGLAGAFTGSSVVGKVSSTILDEFIEDDANEMVQIIERAFSKLALEYLLNQKEAESIVDYLKEDLTSGTLKDMFSSSSQTQFAENLVKNNIEIVVKKRQYISMPKDEDIIKSARTILESIAAETVKEEA